MEFLIVFLIIAFFVAIVTYSLWRQIKPPLSELGSEILSASQYETFSWGKAWVYDNDRLRKSSTTPLLLIHGLGSSLYSWRHQIEALSHHRPIIAIDLLGFGKSEKPINQPYGLDGHAQRVLDILDSKKITVCHLVGCSLGGAISLWLTSQHPERFKKTLVISPAAMPSLAPLPHFTYDSLGPIGRHVISRNIIKVALRGGLAHHDKITPPIIDTYLAPFKEPTAMACFFKSIATIKDPRTYASLKEIKTDVLILRGSGDRVVNKRVIQQITKANPLFQIKQHPIGGHHLMEDEPEWVTEQIESFFTK